MFEIAKQIYKCVLLNLFNIIKFLKKDNLQFTVNSPDSSYT